MCFNPGTLARVLRLAIMMRISIVESQKRLRFVIEGKLIAPWIAELRKTYDAYCSQLDGRLVVIELRNVISIS
jgi:hypothetical protein